MRCDGWLVPHGRGTADEDEDEGIQEKTQIKIESGSIRAGCNLCT